MADAFPRGGGSGGVDWPPPSPPAYLQRILFAHDMAERYPYNVCFSLYLKLAIFWFLLINFNDIFVKLKKGEI